MFRAKTVFVVGAGASVEVDLPMGGELLKKIAQLVDIRFDHRTQVSGDHAIVEALKLILNEGSDVTKINEHITAAWQLVKSAQQAISIDNVIDSLEDTKIETVGKLGIVKAIINAEGASAKFKPTQRAGEEIDLANFSGTWYSAFTQLLTENVKKSDIEKIFQNIEFINFNYDRCLEHYLPFSLASYYGVKVEQIHDIMQSVVMHRPYGTVGRLPWQKGDGPGVKFGSATAQQLAEMSKQIRTFTERVEEGGARDRMRESMAQADRIIFLGFAFHRQNVELIAAKALPTVEILATAYGIPESDKSVIKDELWRFLEFDELFDGWKIQLAPMTCSSFFKEYWRTITAEKGDNEPMQSRAALLLNQVMRAPRFWRSQSLGDLLPLGQGFVMVFGLSGYCLKSHCQ